MTAGKHALPGMAELTALDRRHCPCELVNERDAHNKSLELTPERPASAVDAVYRGSLRAGESAAQLNSMLECPGFLQRIF